MHVTLVNSRLERIKIFDDTITDILNTVWNNDNCHLPFLNSVDPYGNTIFSSKQVKENVIPELEDLKKEQSKNSLIIEKLIEFMSYIDYHEFVLILGD